MAIDPLSGLGDKQAFVEELEKHLKEGTPFQLLRADIIHLKSVNERYGHQAGDIVIKEVGKRFAKEFDSYQLFRIHPVQYMAMGEIKDIDQQNLLEKLSATININDDTYHPKVRLFLLTVDKDDDERKIAAVLKHASSKKELLKERYIDIDDSLKAEALNEDHLLKEILIALEKKSFEVYYQPVLDVESGKMISAESLTRLKGSDGKPIRPDILFTYAEEKRLNFMITDIILHKVCRFLGEHRDLDIGSISINMTPDELLNPELPDKLLQITAEYGVDIKKIRLEMTERTIQRNPSEIIRIMNRLNEIGVGLYLDDFGTGFSNITTLFTMPFECIKLDKSLIDMSHEEDKARMIALLVEMIHIGKAKIIAEGVESDSQREFVRNCGIERVQGWCYAKALPEDEFTAFVKDKGNKRYEI